MAKHLQIVISKNKNVKKERGQGRKGVGQTAQRVAPKPPKGVVKYPMWEWRAIRVQQGLLPHSQRATSYRKVKRGKGKKAKSAGRVSIARNG